MLAELEETLAGLDWDQARAAAADHVGLPAPLPPAALRRAMVDDRFCFVLLAFRGNLPRLGELVNHPGNVAYELPGDTPAAPTPAPRSTVALVAEAGRAMTRWASSGFRTVDDATHDRRWAACTACPELVEPPITLLYQVAVAKGDDRVCGACGCVAARKVRLVTERCPRGRWGEPAATS